MPNKSKTKTFKTLKECIKDHHLLKDKLTKKIKELERNKTITNNILEELYSTYITLKELDRVKSEFIKVVSHQLRTPLSTIRWHLEMILAGEMGKIVREQKEPLSFIHKSNLDLIRVLESMLMALDIEEGKIIVRRNSIRLADLVLKVVTSLESKADEKNIKVRFKGSSVLGEIGLDERKIKFVLETLIGNGIRYTEKGGRVAINLSQKMGNTKKFVLLSVKDSGIGISKKEQKMVFSKFFRSPKAVRFSPGGIGLGLFISKAFVEAHQGKIWLESKEGEGAAFYFTLPIK